MKKTDSKQDLPVIVAIDIGSVAMSLVCLDTEGHPVYHDYRLHRGNVQSLFRDMMDELPFRHLLGFASPSGKSYFTGSVTLFNEQVSVPVTAPRFLQL